MKTNPKHIRAMKDGKAPLEYLITTVDDGDARVLKSGADKYGVRNWRIDKILASTYEAAIKRHLKAWAEGQDNDLDTGEHHFHHIRACCGIVIDAGKHGQLIDDRDRKESIDQDGAPKEESDREFMWTVKYLEIQKNSNKTPLARTKSYGPFYTHREATSFILEGVNVRAGISSIDRITIV